MYASRDSGVGHTIKESNRHSFSTDLEQNKMLRIGGRGSSTSPRHYSVRHLKTEHTHKIDL